MDSGADESLDIKKKIILVQKKLLQSSTAVVGKNFYSEVVFMKFTPPVFFLRNLSKEEVNNYIFSILYIWFIADKFTIRTINAIGNPQITEV